MKLDYYIEGISDKSKRIFLSKVSAVFTDGDAKTFIVNYKRKNEKPATLEEARLICNKRVIGLYVTDTPIVIYSGDSLEFTWSRSWKNTLKGG